jgi:hypothetical protein
MACCQPVHQPLYRKYYNLGIMTNLEAIKGKLSYPLSDNAFNLALLDRGLTGSATYSDKKSLELAHADLLYVLVSTPNISEGGYSISQSDKKLLIQMANGIYSKWSTDAVKYASILKPTVTVVNPW